MQPDTRHASNEGPAAEGEAAEPHTPSLGFGEALANLRHSWRGSTYDESADDDGTDNPERRDEAGQVPDALDAPAHPMTAADVLPAASDPVTIPVELAAPVEQLRGTRWAGATYTVTTDPIRIVGEHAARLSARVTNRHASVAVYLAPTRESLQGPPGRVSLIAGESRDLTHVAEVWAVAASGSCDVEIEQVLR